MTLLLVTATAVCWGLAALFDHMGAQRTRPLQWAFWQRPWGLVALPVAIAVSPAQAFRHPSSQFLFWAVVSSLAVLLAWFTYMLALRDENDASGAVTLISSYPLVSLFILTGLFAQPASWTLWVGTGIVCAGASLVQQTSSSTASRRMLISSAMSSLSWGIWAVADWNALRYGTPLQLVALTSALALVSAMPLALGMRIFRRPIALPKESRLPSLASGVLYAASEFTFYFALAAGRTPGYVIALTAAYPLITMLGACVRGTERFTAERMAAIGVLAVGVGILQG